VSPEIVTLTSVPGFVVFDLPGVPESAGGTRLAPDVSVAEVALLARAMTYKYAVLGEQVGGAKAGVRGDPADHQGKAALMARFCSEIKPLADSGRLLTGPDMGTAEEDFVPLRERRAVPAAIRAESPSSLSRSWAITTVRLREPASGPDDSCAAGGASHPPRPLRQAPGICLPEPADLRSSAGPAIGSPRT
jgi:Glu/Leu/Phe/Val dehydrogenase, dimerisation domain